MNVREALALGRERLASGVEWEGTPGGPTETPNLDAEVLLRHMLGATRARLFTHPERELDHHEEQRYLDALRRRQHGEPVAYITGQQEFMGLAFSVDRRVLIPRPDTETLVERALDILTQRWRANPASQFSERGPLVVDVGTGSGAIAVSLAALGPRLRVVATDVSSDALTVAVANGGRLATQRIGFVQSYLLNGVAGPFDLVAANLPYIRSCQMAHLPFPVRDYEPRSALDGGEDGLDLYRALLRDLPGKLTCGGALLMECDPDQAGTLLGLATSALSDTTGRIVKDLAGLDRIVEVIR